jgi:hypothetical protein
MACTHMNLLRVVSRRRSNNGAFRFIKESVRTMNGGELNFSLFENKRNVDQIPKTKIVEAYGLQKCPRLVEQVADDDLQVRVNALAVVCDEFKNPYIIQGCAQAGIIKVLASMISDPDHTTRVRASRALSLAAADANGLESILFDEAIPEILQGMNDQSLQVRKNVYECLCHATRTTDGVNACVKAGVTVEFVNAVTAEEDQIKPTMLKTIHNSCKVEEGLQDVLNTRGVAVLIDLLRNTASGEVTLQAARALGFICFSDLAKERAILNKGIAVLVLLLKDTPPEEVKVALTFALMAVTSTDEGKIQLCDSDGVSVLISTLQESNRLVKLNVLKVISNVAVYPHARSELLLDSSGYDEAALAALSSALEEQDVSEYGDEITREILPRTPHGSVVKVLQKLKTEAAESGDKLLEKHLSIALDAVQWSA